MPELNIIFPESLDLSLAAIGILSTMLNDPEKDYCTMSELYKTIPVGSLTTLSMALAELLDKHYLILLGNRTYAINKKKIVEMKII